MAPLVVDPEALFGAGSAVVAAGDGLGAGLTILASGFAAHTGRDVAGMVFGLAYQDAAASLVAAAAAVINACRHTGALIQQGASNYSRAEAISTLGGGGGVLTGPAEPVPIAAPGPPGAPGAGSADGQPSRWALVAPFVDDVWPDGDVVALRAAAGRWRGFAGAVAGTQSTLAAATSLLDSQQIPEGGQIDDALSRIGAVAGGLAGRCSELAATLEAFAGDVEQARAAIRDLLQRLRALTDIAHDVVLILDGDVIDEIMRIAEDVGAVLHNQGRQARAIEQGIRLGMKAVDGLVVGLEKYTRGQLTHFLGNVVGNQVATTLDVVANANEGALKGAIGMALATADLDPGWFLADPQGAGATWKAVTTAMTTAVTTAMTTASPVGILLHPTEGMQAELRMVKSQLHLEDWRGDRPGLGLGENLFDGAALVLPGAGEAGVVAEGAGGVARGAEAAAEVAGSAERAAAAGGLATELDELGGAAPRVPAGGSPAPLPAQSGHPAPAPLQRTDVPSAAQPGHQPAEQPGRLGEQSAPDAATGARHTISGHGAYSPAHGHATVPPGTSITVYAEHGSIITDDLGNLIETGGDTSGVYSKTFQAGEALPDYTIYPPDDLNIMGTPQTVSRPTLLSELVHDGMGPVDLAVCTYDASCPTGKVYDVDGIFDDWTGTFQPYGRYGF